MRRVGIAVAVVVLSISGGFAAGRAVSVIINNTELDAKGYRIERGQVVGPVKPVAEALGATVEFIGDGPTLYVERPSLWQYGDYEPGYKTVRPYDWLGLGPTLAVRRHLAQVQEQWFTKGDAKAPLLARYEIIDMAHGYMPPDEPADSGFGVSALLYWAHPKPDGPPLLARQAHGEPGTRMSWGGVMPAKVVIEQVRYHVKPTKLASGRRDDGDMSWTATDWVVEGEGELEERREVAIKGDEEVVAVYDMTSTVLP